jgi:hypothetical protein
MSTALIEPKPIDTAFMYLPIDNLKEDSSKVYLAHDICNTIGYFPLVGTIAGIARIIFSAIAYCFFDNTQFREFCKFNLLRGLIELIPFAGIALLITDIVQNIRFRHMFSQP